jgi:hypothetical protein
MAQDGNLTRRMMGMVSTRIPQLDLESLRDPRAERGMQWSLSTLIGAMLLGGMAGCKNLAEVETMTAEMSEVTRRRLKIRRRVPDTTMRDAAVVIDPEDVCRLIRRSAQQADRRKALQSDGFPLDVVAMDGKWVSVEDLDNHYAQTQKDADGLGARGLVRTISCLLATCTARVLLEVVPMGSKSNEVGFFASAFNRVLMHHKSRFDLVTYDAGACSAANAKLVVESGKHYLFSLKDERRFLRQKAEEVLGNSTNVKAQTVDVLSKKDNVRMVRRLFMAEAPNGYRDIRSVRTILRVQAQKLDGEGKVLFSEDRYFISDLLHSRLTPEQWLKLVRMHWQVEVFHGVMDVSFEEDERPWITHHAQGMLVALLLRRLAYNLLALFRSVTQRSDEKRATPWKAVFRWMRNALEQATEQDVADLREREVTPAFR